MTCSYSDPNWLAQFIISIVFLGVAFVSEILFSLFFQNDSSNKKDALNCENREVLIRFNIFRFFAAIMVSIRVESYAYYVRNKF